MADTAQEKIVCPICHKEHETMKMAGVTFIGCPEVPENWQIPFNKCDSDGKLEFARTPTSNAR